MKDVRVGLVGLGYWGPNLLRNLRQLKNVTVTWICDQHVEGLSDEKARGTQVTANYEDLLNDPELDGILIAVPVAHHHQLAKQALEAGKDVFVEKPLSHSVESAQELLDLAERKQAILMVGHTFLYSPPVRALKDYIDHGELGTIYSIMSSRLNLGIVRQDVDALWNLAPHDLSIICYLLDDIPQTVQCQGVSHLQTGIDDFSNVTLEFNSGVLATVQVSWLYPKKERRMTFVGSRKMIDYDDMAHDGPLTLYDKGIDIDFKPGESMGTFDDFAAFQLIKRAGDVLIPRIDNWEPLRREMQDFIDAIRSRTSPLADGHEGLRVVKILEAATQSRLQQKTISLD